MLSALLAGCGGGGGGGGSSGSGNGGGNCLGTEPGFCGTLTGLPSGVSVTLNFSTSDAGGGNLTLAANGPFKFELSTQVDITTTWNVTVTATTPGATCNVTNGGNNVDSNGEKIQEITGVVVTCVSAPTYTIGGALSGLNSGAQLTLENNGANPLVLGVNGTFSFPSAVAPGSAYNVTVSTQPTDELCTVSQGIGSNVNANVTSIAVSCSLAYSIGGTLAGLESAGTITLENNGSDALTLTANGAFTFSTAVVPGGAYDVTESSEPINQNCTITSGSGSASGNITGVQVTCTTLEQILYAFDGGKPDDGSRPYAGLIMDSAGNLYGTTLNGGDIQNCTGGCGTVFELAPNGSGGYTESILYAFTDSGGDGANPEAGVIMDHAGNLYGTTTAGGQSGCVTGCGTVFKLAPNGSGGYTESVLYSFPTLNGSPGTHGGNPEAGLIMDSAGNLYGTTVGGGTVGSGVAFELTPNGTGGYIESVLYSFGTDANANYPNTPLTMDGAGDLYGITEATVGGVGDQCGSVFRLAPNGSGGYTETDLYVFPGCIQPSVGPNPGLIIDGAGNLYGTECAGAGEFVFELTPNGSGGYTESGLGSGGLSGGPIGDSEPCGGVVMDGSGNLYGATYSGGGANSGVVFKLTPNGSGDYTQSTLYSFAGPNVGSILDGANPTGALILDSAGNLYGTTTGGGFSVGTVFEIFAH